MIRPLMAAAVVALGGLLYLQWRDWPPALVSADSVEGTATTSGDSSDEASKPLIELEPSKDRREFDVVAERPLFRPDRRPKKKEKEPEQPQVAQETIELDGFDLTAVLITGDYKRAWLKDPREQKASEVREGDDVSGWTVSRIDAEFIILKRQGEPHTIDLLDFSKPAAQPIRRGRAARGAPPVQPARARPPKARSTAPASRNPRTNRNARTPSRTPARPEQKTRPPRS